jgi:hypothetical protein
LHEDISKPTKGRIDLSRSKRKPKTKTKGSRDLICSGSRTTQQIQYKRHKRITEGTSSLTNRDPQI